MEKFSSFFESKTNVSIQHYMGGKKEKTPYMAAVVYGKGDFCSFKAIGGDFEVQHKTKTENPVKLIDLKRDKGSIFKLTLEGILEFKWDSEKIQDLKEEA